GRGPATSRSALPRSIAAACPFRRAAAARRGRRRIPSESTPRCCRRTSTRSARRGAYSGTSSSWRLLRSTVEPIISDWRCSSDRRESDLLRAVPQGQFAERPQVFQPLDDGQERISRKLAGFAGKTARAVGDQDFRFADPARVEQDLSGGRIAGGVLIADAGVEPAERDPARLAAPSHVDDALAVRQQPLKPGAGLRRRRALEAGGKDERPG